VGAPRKSLPQGASDVVTPLNARPRYTLSDAIIISNKMHSDTADFAPGAATWRTWPNLCRLWL